ncbi:MAG: carboxypeptidase regulatory-like domain-containing protein [Terriglobia bacterium]
MLHKLSLCLTAALLLLVFTVGSKAQSTFGSITGTVTDPSGAVVPNAQVLVTNEGTGAVRTVNTSSAGVFNVPDLDFGVYRAQVTAKGFTTFERSGLHLAANQILNLNVTLNVGAASTVVQVHAATPVINTEATDISGSMNHQAIEQLPLVSRHAADQGIYTYALFNTGVEAVPTSSLDVVDGARLETGTIPTMDGIAVMAYFQGAGPVQPGFESVQEVKVETAVAPAEFATAGNIQVITKGGTNQFHGGAFWDYNGNDLNARQFFSSSVPFRVYNDFGASLGGPIKKNKLFFFGDYEGSREAAKGLRQEDVPLPAWRNGDFSSLLPGTPLVNPLTKQPFAGNIIPPSMISKVSQNIQNYIYPLPNTGAPGQTSNNWQELVPSNTGFTDFNNIDARVDYDPRPHDSVFARASWRKMPLYFEDCPYPLAVPQYRWGKSGVIAWTHILNPSAVNELWFGGTYHRNFYEANAFGNNLLQQFGIQGISTAGIHDAPEFDITGVTAWDLDADCDSYESNPETTLEVIDDVIWTSGRHLMKFGFDAVRDRLDGNKISSNVYGQYSFTGVYSGSGYGDFLLGIPQTTTAGLPSPEWDFRGTTYGLYGQDQFKVNSKLTLNYGLRWELQEPYSSKTGSIYNFDPQTGALVIPDAGANHVSPFFPTNVPIETASQAHYPAGTLLSFNGTNFQPRMGFAYKLFNKTVIRGGYGVYTNLIYAPLIRGAMSGGPFSGSATYINAINNGVPLFSFPHPFLTSGTSSTQNVNGINSNLKDPYTQQWQLSVERQIGSIGLRISYLGARSDQLIFRRNLNQPAPSTTPFSTSERRYPIYNQVIYSDSGGNDSYNGLEISAQKKYGQNLSFNSGWTWSKDLTDTQDSGGGGTSFGGQVIQNQFDRAVEESNNGLTLPQRFFTYALYTLPVGQGQHFLSGVSKPVQEVLGGWRTTWTVTAQSGQWFTPSFSGFDTSNTATFGGRPDRIANGNLPSSQRSITNWFNPAALKIPGCPDATPVCSNPADVGRFGNSGLFILSGPPIFDVDFGLAKDFSLGEHARLRFSMTMANALNHPNFAAPRSNISATSTVATISGSERALVGEPAPREIDFGLRLLF